MKLVPVGPAGAEETARIAVEGAKARGIRHLVVASSSGATAELFRDCGLQVTVVTLAYGSKEPGKNVMEEAERQKLKDWGFSVCTAAHALSAAERAISGAAGGSWSFSSPMMRMWWRWGGPASAVIRPWSCAPAIPPSSLPPKSKRCSVSPVKRGNRQHEKALARPWAAARAFFSSPRRRQKK